MWVTDRSSDAKIKRSDLTKHYCNCENITDCLNLLANGHKKLAEKFSSKIKIPVFLRFISSVYSKILILHKIYDIEITEGLLQLSNNTATRGHSLKLSSQPSRIEIRRNSFSVRVVKPWNSLPQEVVMSPSVKAFEARLDRFWKDQPMMFDYKEELRL